MFCFFRKKNNYFPGWHGENLSFEILIVSIYSLFKNATAALKHEKRWQKLMNMTNPLVSYIFCPLPPFSSNLWAFWRSHLWFWTFWNQNLYLSHVSTWLNENNHRLAPFASISSVQSLSRVRLFATPRTKARQASLSITNSWSSPKPMSIESMMPSNHLILYHPLLLLPSIVPSIKVSSKESAVRIRWPK